MLAYETKGTGSQRQKIRAVYKEHNRPYDKGD